jgi:hypothetical protein
VNSLHGRKLEPRGPFAPQEPPAFIMGVVSVRLGEPKRFLMKLQHKREAFKPTRLYAHLTQAKAFILDKVDWGMRKEEQVICPIDLNEFGLTQRGLELALPRLRKTERIVMSMLYTGHPIPGYNNGDIFSLPIIWAEPGASLLNSENVTLTYSVE